MSKDDADMGDVNAGGTATKPEIPAAVIMPDPIASFVDDARAILQGSTTPNDAQQQDLMKSLFALLSAAPAQQTTPDAESGEGEKNGPSQFGPMAQGKNGNKAQPY